MNEQSSQIASGYLVLEGGAEFSGRMAEVDQRALALAGGVGVAIDIIPAAAAPDNNHDRAGNMGVAWFKKLGAKNVRCRLLIDHASAQDQGLAEQLSRSRLIYILGGFPAHLAHSLLGTRCWQSILQAYHRGGVIIGSSAGAMVLCEHYYDPRADRIEAGLNVMPQACVIPHYETAGSRRVTYLQSRLPDSVLIGIDEQTGLINDAATGGWAVYGAGRVVLHSGSRRRVYGAGTIIPYRDLPPANGHSVDV